GGGPPWSRVADHTVLAVGISAVVPHGRDPSPDLTVLAKLKPLDASQLMDHVIAPRMLGHVKGGTNVLQLVPFARQLSAATTTDGATTPPPAALACAGNPSPTWSGRRPFCNWMQARAVSKSSVP